MDQDRRFESVYSKKVRAGRRRTYFFDVRRTRGDDFYLTLTESTKRMNGHGYERHKIFLYKEDFNRFLANLEEVVRHIKTDLMPDYDYEEFDRRELEWEARRAAEGYFEDDHDDDGQERRGRQDRPDGPEREPRVRDANFRPRHVDPEDEEIEEELPPPPPVRRPEPPIVRREKHPDVDDDLSW